jgi:signal transduction histidine kinase
MPALVLEDGVKVLTNPIVGWMLIGLAALGVLLLIAIVVGRRIRRAFMEDPFIAETNSMHDQLPMHAYNAVIQELKQQKHELLSLQQSEHRRAKTTENISAAVLSHLSSGVLFLTSKGLVRQANTAAKNILGFGSPSGMSIAELFRDATLTSSRTRETLAEAVEACLMQESCRSLEAQYVTPGGDHRILEVVITSVKSSSGETLGGACLINDKTEIAQIQQQQELRQEMSAEMALALRTSLATISGYAQQISSCRDAGLTRQLASDIVLEAAQLDRTMGGFLAGARAAKGAGA